MRRSRPVSECGGVGVGPRRGHEEGMARDRSNVQGAKLVKLRHDYHGRAVYMWAPGSVCVVMRSRRRRVCSCEFSDLSSRGDLKAQAALPFATPQRQRFAGTLCTVYWYVRHGRLCFFVSDSFFSIRAAPVTASRRPFIIVMRMRAAGGLATALRRRRCRHDSTHLRHQPPVTSLLALLQNARVGAPSSE